MTQATNAGAPIPIPTLTPEPSELEQSHVEDAIEASQTAMDAIGTVTDVASYTLTILGVFIAILALWGVGMIVKAARDSAKQIANKRLDDYIEGDEFKALLNSRVDEAVRRERLDAIARKLDELSREAEDEAPFAEKGEGQ